VAWGTPEVPVLIFSESTYSTGYHSAYARPGKPIVRSTGSYVQGQASKFGQADYPGYIQEWQQRWKDWGAHAEFVGGLWINRIPEENFAENLYHLAKNTRGYWLYDMLSLGDNPPSKLPGNGPEAYWQEITRANLELDKLLESKGAYVSKLKVRNFSLPAPSVSLELWKKVDLPLIKAAPGRAEFLSRGAEQIFYIPAARNDEIKLTIVGDSAHPTKLKEGAVAIVLVDPTGQVIKWDKLTREDFSKSRQPNGRYAGRREVSFQAPEAGTYSLFLNGGGRYAYTIGASSHPWVASLQQPKGTCLWRPKKIFVRTLPGAKQAELWFGTSNTTTVNVIDPKGRQLASGTIASGGKVTIDLPQAKAQVLMVTFEGGSIVTLTRVTGLEPWFCSSPNAPFPRR
jgi:hypothetical protein